MSLDAMSSFKHVYQDNLANKTLVLLHGTGGDEHDLLPLAQKLHLEANILSLRGNIVENGMNRFFRRVSFGVFDEASILEEVEKLRTFILAYLDLHAMDSSDLFYLGYSNGANMILSLALVHPQMVTSAALMHPMLVLETKKKNLQHARIAVTYGKNDEMIPLKQTQAALNVLQDNGAQVKTFSHPGGHEITLEEIEFIADFFQQKKY